MSQSRLPTWLERRAKRKKKKKSHATTHLCKQSHYYHSACISLLCSNRHIYASLKQLHKQCYDNIQLTNGIFFAIWAHWKDSKYAKTKQQIILRLFSPDWSWSQLLALRFKASQVYSRGFLTLIEGWIKGTPRLFPSWGWDQGNWSFRNYTVELWAWKEKFERIRSITLLVWTMSWKVEPRSTES